MRERSRWRVDCRKQRGTWRTLQSESYDDVAGALRSLAAQCLEEWDSVALVRLRGAAESTQGLLVCGRGVGAPLLSCLEERC